MGVGEHATTFFPRRLYGSWVSVVQCSGVQECYQCVVQPVPVFYLLCFQFRFMQCVQVCFPMHHLQVGGLLAGADISCRIIFLRGDARVFCTTVWLESGLELEVPQCAFRLVGAPECNVSVPMPALSASSSRV